MAMTSAFTCSTSGLASVSNLSSSRSLQGKVSLLSARTVSDFFLFAGSPLHVCVGAMMWSGQHKAQQCFHLRRLLWGVEELLRLG